MEQVFVKADNTLLCYGAKQPLETYSPAGYNFSQIVYFLTALFLLSLWGLPGISNYRGINCIWWVLNCLGWQEIEQDRR